MFFRFSPRRAFFTLAVALGSGLIGGYFGSRQNNLPPPPPPPSAASDFAASVESLRPSVAQIIADRPRDLSVAAPETLSYSDMFPLPEGFEPPLSAGPLPPPPAPPSEEADSSIGSAFFISADGYLLTNAHVVSGAKSIVIRLSDRSEVSARLVGADPRSDIALLKADGGPYVPAPIGNPSEAKVGEWVLAIGSPFGFEASATVGVLSAKGRFLPDGSFLPFLQTDAAINPGNSGGPLFNAKGQVIGINSEIYSRSGGYMGISFAIPIDQAILIADKLKSSGSVSHGRIGAVVQDLTAPLAEALGVPGKRGAIVIEVDPDGPAAIAGLQRGDAVLSFGGAPLDGSSDFVRRVAQSDPGKPVALSVSRKRKTISLSILVGGDAPEAADPPAYDGPPMEMVAFPPEKARRLGFESGLEILEPGDRGFSAGLRAGDILVMANGAPLADPRDFERATRSGKPSAPSALLVWREGTLRFLAYR